MQRVIYYYKSTYIFAYYILNSYVRIQVRCWTAYNLERAWVVLYYPFINYLQYIYNNIITRIMIVRSNNRFRDPICVLITKHYVQLSRTRHRQFVPCLTEGWEPSCLPYNCLLDASATHTLVLLVHPHNHWTI